MRHKRFFAGIAAAGAAIALLAACPNPAAPAEPVAGLARLFAVDSKNGNVYEIDTEAKKAADIPIVSVNQNATGEIAFAGTVGFVAVGDYLNMGPGLYRFDAAAAVPSAVRIGATAISAQYVCLVSEGKGYVSAYDYDGSTPNGLFSFDPADPAAGLSGPLAGSTGKALQDVALGADGRLYVADNANGKVLRIDPENDTVLATLSVSRGGATGLLAGAYEGKPGVFVANTGGYDANWNPLPGSVEFVSGDLADGSTATMVMDMLSVGRLAAFSPTVLVASCGYPAKTVIVDLSGASPVATEVLYGSAAFGSLDIAIVDGTAYVPDGANTVYAFDAAGLSVAKIIVGKTGELVGNVGVR